MKDGTIIEFLHGSHTYEGVAFGDLHPTRVGRFWWRSILREYLSAPSPSVSAEEVLTGDDLAALINRHIGPMYGSLEMASIDYFKQTGTINGSFMLRLISLLKFHQYKLQEHFASRKPAGMRWVKASERLPESETSYHLKVYGRPGFGKWYEDRKEFGFESTNRFGTIGETHFNEIEWLDESTPAEYSLNNELGTTTVYGGKPAGEGYSSHRKCQCNPNDKHGQTSVMCCNDCGLPDEDFWQPPTPSNWIEVKEGGEMPDGVYWLCVDGTVMLSKRIAGRWYYMADIINNITKNMKELLEKRGVKLMELVKDKSLEERMQDIEKMLLQKKIIWMQATEKNFDEDWMFRHYRYKADHFKLDTDLFEVRDGALMKIGGTGRLPFNEIEILVEL